MTDGAVECCTFTEGLAGHRDLFLFFNPDTKGNVTCKRDKREIERKKEGGKEEWNSVRGAMCF